jgi:hypothetical protein
MARTKPIIRRADGTRENRSPEQILAQVAADPEIKNLPGNGKKIDLHGYFTSDPSQRIANRLLSDNKVLPQPLQNRKEAETHKQEAAAQLERA